MKFDTKNEEMIEIRSSLNSKERQSAGTKLATAIICYPLTTAQSPSSIKSSTKLSDAKKVYIGVFIPSLVIVIVLVSTILFIVFRGKISWSRARKYVQSDEVEVEKADGEKPTELVEKNKPVDLPN